MIRSRHWTFLLLTAFAGAMSHAAQRELVFIAPTNHTMPFAQFKDGRLNVGILKDLGEAIAQRMGRQARFISVPSKRVGMVLAAGEADAVCYVKPEWIDGNFNWSVPFIPNGGTVVAQPDAPRVHSLPELAGKRVGTVLGYRYPQLEAALGDQFLRDDAPSMEHTFSKMRAHRMQYALIEKMTIAYHMRKFRDARLRVDFEFDAFKAQCAFARSSAVPFADSQRAIAAMVDAGAVDAILDHYR
jgi:polar amino acid transport system substrate-binding protein